MNDRLDTTLELPRLNGQAWQQRWLSWLSPGVPFASARATTRAGMAIAFSMAVLTVASFLRAIWTGTLNADDCRMPPERFLVVAVSSALALAVSSWLFLKCWAGARQLSWRRLWTVALLIQAGAVFALPLTSNDLHSNLANGRLRRAGLNPYRHTPADLGTDDPFQACVSRVWYRTPTPYGPILTWMSRLAAVSDSVWRAVWIYKSETVAVVLGMLLLTFGYCRTCLDAEAAPRSFVFMAWNPLVAWELTGQVHNDAVMVAACVAFAWAARQNRQWLAGLALLIAFFAKFAVAPLVGLYGLFVLRRSPWRGLAMGAVGVLVSLALFYPFWDGPATLSAPLSAAGSEPWRTCNSFIAVAARMIGWVERPNSRWQLDTFLLWSWSCKIGLAALALRMAWRARTLANVLSDSLLFMFLYECLAKGWFFPWYILWLFPLALAEGSRNWQWIVGWYASLAPLVYTRYDGCVIGALALHGVPLILWWLDRRGRKSATESASVDSEPLDASPLAA